MSIRTLAIKASLRSGLTALKISTISPPSGLTPDLLIIPNVIDKSLYTKGKEQGVFIVAEKGRVAYLEPMSRDSERYECATLPEFMQRFFSRKIDFACTVEMARLDARRALAGKPGLSGEHFVSHRKDIKASFADRLDKYLNSLEFKFYVWLARV